MWSRLDDALADHKKIIAAGEMLGANGAAIAIGMYAVGLMWANKHLTDGRLPVAVVRQFRQCDQPLKVAAALVRAGLWERNGDLFTIHDFGDFNYSAREIKAKRDRDRARKRNGAA
jgi:hypothetical protein